jgi:hypothetical protein
MIYELGSMRFTKQNDRYEQYQSKRVVTLIETEFINHECFHMKCTCRCLEEKYMFPNELGAQVVQIC